MSRQTPGGQRQSNGEHGGARARASRRPRARASSALAVIIGIVLLNVVDDGDDGPDIERPARAAETTTTTTGTEPCTTETTTDDHGGHGAGEDARPSSSVLVLNGGAPQGAARHDVRQPEARRATRTSREPSRLGRSHADRQRRLVQGRPRPGSRRARDRGRRRARPSTPFPIRRRRAATAADCVVVVGARRLSTDRCDSPSSRSRSGPVAMSIAVHAIAERAFEHRAVGRRVDARRRELGLVVHRAGALDRRCTDGSTASRATRCPCRSRTSSRSSSGSGRPSVVRVGAVQRRRARGRAPSARSRARRRSIVERGAGRERAGLEAAHARAGGARRARRSVRRARHPEPSVCAGTTLAASPPRVTTPCTWSPGRRCWRRSPIATCATVNASAALMPSSGAAAACDSLARVVDTRSARPR